MKKKLQKQANSKNIRNKKKIYEIKIQNESQKEGNEK